MAKYIFIKNVKESIAEYSENPIRLQEFTTFISGIAEADWGIDPNGAQKIGNSDGSISILGPFEGFRLMGNRNNFYISYEHHGGIVVHTNGSEMAEKLCRNFAKKRNATYFEE